MKWSLSVIVQVKMVMMDKMVKMDDFFRILLVVAYLTGSVASAVEISHVREGRLAAFSFTYDDGARAHYTDALPLHEKYGFPATFLIITDRVEDDNADRALKNCSWAELKQMADKGMEVASHTKSHRNMRELESAGITKEMAQDKKRDELLAMREPNWSNVWSEVELSKKALEEHTGQIVRTYAFAGNACPDWTGRILAKAKGYVRAGNIRIATGRGDTEESYKKQLDEKVMVSNRVCCAMIHGIGTGKPGDGWNPAPSLEVFESLFRLVAERRDRLYIDTYGNNAAYETRAANTRLAKIKDKPGAFMLVLSDSPRGVCAPGEIWLRLSPGEKVSVNGQLAVPNAYNAVLAHTGDEITVMR